MPTSNERVLADAVAAIATTHDLADVLSQLVTGCAAAYPADAVAIMARNHGGRLELLSANSHRAEELELLQIQESFGPCVDAMTTDTRVIAVGRLALVERWGDVGTAIAEAGFAEVHAFPMRWRGTTLGALNIFVRLGAVTDPTVGQLFADLATLAVLRTSDLSEDELAVRVHQAVAGRAVLEQAKGVLAYHLNLGMDAAHGVLLARAATAGLGLTAIAEQIVAEQYRTQST
jgi:hypothetical protein